MARGCDYQARQDSRVADRDRTHRARCCSIVRESLAMATASVRLRSTRSTSDDVDRPVAVVSPLERFDDGTVRGACAPTDEGERRVQDRCVAHPCGFVRVRGVCACTRAQRARDQRRLHEGRGGQMLNHSTESARSVEAVYSRGTEMIDAGAATMMRSEVTALDVAQVPRRRGFPEPLEMEQVMVAGDRHHREWHGGAYMRYGGGAPAPADEEAL